MTATAENYPREVHVSFGIDESQSSLKDTERRSYSAPALEKGLDILEILCRSEYPLTQKEIAKVKKSTVVREN